MNKLEDKGMRMDRLNWMINHTPSEDPICSEMCLDVCCAYNKVANLEAVK